MAADDFDDTDAALLTGARFRRNRSFMRMLGDRLCERPAPGDPPERADTGEHRSDALNSATAADRASASVPRGTGCAPEPADVAAPAPPAAVAALAAVPSVEASVGD